MDPYTVATWRARLLARHHQAILETLVILAVFLLVLLFAGAAGAAQTAVPAQPVKPAMGQMKMGQMKMGEMKQACEAKHEASAKDVEALAKTVTAATASEDPAVLRAALAATLRHLEEMQAKAAKCAGMIAEPAVAAEPPKEPPTQKPDDPAHKH